MVEQGHKYQFLILILGKSQYGRVIGNEMVQWETPQNPGRYGNSIQSKDTAFDCSKSKKKHARKAIKYEKTLGLEESLRKLILQPVDKLFVEALKEEYI